MKMRSLWILLAAIGLQLGILMLAYFVGVMDPPQAAEGKLKGNPGSPMQQREMQQQMEQQMAAVNRMNDAMAQTMTAALVDAAHPLPHAPPTDWGSNLSAMAAAYPVVAFAGEAADGMFDDSSESLSPLEPITFMGESLSATRIVLAIDVSASVKSKLERAGLSVHAVREEVRQFIAQLGPNHLFGLILFTRNWMVFRDGLVPATAAIKAEASGWLDRHFRTDGSSGRDWQRGQPNGIQAVMRVAFAMDPALNEIFLLSDGDFYRTPAGGGGQSVPWPELRADLRRLQESNIGTARLRVLAFYPPDASGPPLREWVRENGNGSLRIVAD